MTALLLDPPSSLVSITTGEAMPTYLGLDVSPLRIGAASIETDGILWRLKWAETYKFNKDEWVSPAHRAEAIEYLHEKHNDEPQAIGLEAVFIGPNKLGSIRAAMALGQIESICDYEWPDTPQKILTAAQWRRYCGIKQGGKEPVMEWALKVVDDWSDDDIKLDQDSADAIAIAYAVAMWDMEDDDDA